MIDSCNRGRCSPPGTTFSSFVPFDEPFDTEPGDDTLRDRVALLTTVYINSTRCTVNTYTCTNVDKRLLE
jgi:hypothetical protein